MSRTKKVMVAISLVFLLVALVAGLWWWKNGEEFLANLRRQGQENIEEGRHYGRSHKPIECLAFATDKAKKCEAGDLLCEPRTRAFLNGCLPETNDFPQFCTTLPNYEDRVDRLSWAVGTCANMGQPDERCARVVNDASVLCAQRESPPAHAKNQ